MPSHKLTAKQREYAEYLFEHGFMIHNVGCGIMNRNRPLWALVELGLAEFRFGPSGSWLQTYGFNPIWTDPVC